MKVYNLSCEHDHRFEGWFASEDDFLAQSERSLIACPVCGSPVVRKLLSAPRLNLSGAKPPQEPSPPHSQHAEPGDDEAQSPPHPHDTQQALLALARAVIDNTEDVGENFAEEARRIHYNEAPERAIRGVATPDERAVLADEGIDVQSFVIPAGLKGILH